jgi:hypothetical protein
MLNLAFYFAHMFVLRGGVEHDLAQKLLFKGSNSLSIIAFWFTIILIQIDPLSRLIQDFYAKYYDF